MARTDYDLVTVGSGSAAFAAAIRATTLGARVALVEAGAVGGTCVNVGCIPSKALLAAAETYHRAGAHPFAGITIAPVGVDMAKLVAGKDEIIETLQREKYLELAESYGFEIISGHARFIGPTRVRVAGKELAASRFLIATGAAPFVPSIPGLAEAGYLTSTTAMALDHLPESLVLIGGNFIGLEMGQLFADLGVRVTLVEALDRLAPGEEPEVSAWITDVLTDQGVEVVTSATVVGVEGGEPKAVIVESDGARRRLETADILVATGRRPVLEGLGLDVARIQLDERGLILDDELRTTNPAVYAAGDVTGAPQFVYVAAAQGTLAADNAVGAASRRMDYTALPRVTFTSPTIAAVGMTDAQAQTAGYDCECRVLELANVPRTQVNRDLRGGIKVVTSYLTPPTRSSAPSSPPSSSKRATPREPVCGPRPPRPRVCRRAGAHPADGGQGGAAPGRRPGAAHPERPGGDATVTSGLRRGHLGGHLENRGTHGRRRVRPCGRAGRRRPGHHLRPRRRALGPHRVLRGTGHPGGATRRALRPHATSRHTKNPL